MGGGVGTRREIGDEAEQSVVEHLQREGYSILARNFLCRYGELDVVAERAGIVCFVEVRMRSTAAWGDPAHTISRAKQRRVVQAALRFLFAHDLRDKMIRFDVVSIVGRGPNAALEHIPNAFDAGM